MLRNTYSCPCDGSNMGKKSCKPLSAKNCGQRKISSFFSASAALSRENKHSNVSNTFTSNVSCQENNASSSSLSRPHDISFKTESSRESFSRITLTNSTNENNKKLPQKSSLVPDNKTLPMEEDTDFLEFSSDSDTEIVECTPEIKKKNNPSIILLKKITESPEIIPQTPEAYSSCKVPNNSLFSKSNFGISDRYKIGSTSLHSNKSFCASNSVVIKPRSLSLKGKVTLNRLFKKNREKSNISPIKENVTKTKLNSYLTSVKRPAVTGTGVSPDSKRTNDSGRMFIDEGMKSCKLDLLGKFDSCSSLVREQDEKKTAKFQPNMEDEKKDKSFSMLEHSIKFQENTKDLRKNSKEIPGEHLHDLDKVILSEEIGGPCTGTGETFLETNGVFCHLYQKGESEEDKHAQMKCENVSGSPAELYIPFEGSICSQGFIIDKSANDNLGMNKVSTGTEMQDNFEDLFNDDLALDFEKMSPFKQQYQDKEPLDVENKKVKKLIEEGLGTDSYACQGNFGRYVVTAVEQDAYKGSLLLRLASVQNNEVKTCKLDGFWSQSVVSEGDIVHILFTNLADEHFTIDNSKGLIVINPDFLISGTSVVSAVFCRRKAVLNERFKGMDSGNQLMLIGSLVHQLFQEVVKKKTQTPNELDRLVQELMSQPKILQELYGIGISEAHIYEEMKNFIPYIHAWSQVYLESSCSVKIQEKEKRKNQWNGKIVEIQDIEENIWSPKFGVKGKIDLTVKTNEHGVSKVMPLELKTGRPSFSAEHRGQVTLYSMMSSDRRQDPKAGLLLYLKDGSMVEVPAGDSEKRGLIQLRNEIIHYLTAKPVLEEGLMPSALPPLPEPIDFERACMKCAHLLTCSVYQKSNEEPIPEAPHAMATLVPKVTDHLQKAHLDYFRHWCLLLHLEVADGRRDSAVRALWCQDPIKRESSGDCLSWLVLESAVTVSEVEAGQFVHSFARSPTHPSSTKLPTVGLQIGDNVVVSSETEIALSLGVIFAFEEASVKVVLDRDLKLYSNWHKKQFHVDRCEYQNTMCINFTNLAKLLMDTPQAAHLRALLIDRNLPSFKQGLSKEVVFKGKHIIKALNKTQQRAVLKTLMAESYSLLKGYPGTGKTSIIVALVRLMVTQGLSVLLTSYTHSAVDNILLKLRMYDVDFLRLGRLSRIHPDLRSHADEIVTQKFKSVSSFSEFYESKLVVATTCLGINHVIFSKRKFDFCIIDEASQVLQVAALGPLFHASRFVLVGDPQQLPPVVQSNQAKNLGMSESLFKRLDSQGATSNLTQQYRMNGPIMKITNLLMYDNQLQCANSHLETATLNLPNYDSLVESGKLSIWLQKIVEPSLRCSVMFLDTCGAAAENHNGSNSVVNSKEAAIVVAIIQALIEAGLTADGVGVITPYRAQVKQIHDLVVKEVTMGQRVEVNTVDQYQGRDKDVILYSCVRSGALKFNASEILEDDRRLNVAVTRAKYKLIMVGDTASLHIYTPFRKLATILEPHQIYQLKNGQEGFVWQDTVSL